MNKTTLTTENRSTLLYNPFLLDMSIFNELVIKNDLVEKATPFFVFMEDVHLSQDQALVPEDRTFHRNVLGFRVSRSSVKDVQGLSQFVINILNSKRELIKLSCF